VCHSPPSAAPPAFGEKILDVGAFIWILETEQCLGSTKKNRCCPKKRGAPDMRTTTSRARETKEQKVRAREKKKKKIQFAIDYR
jgi:hypothetical protein